MGCFNKKCALTQLAIRPGDPVVMLFGVRPDSNEQRADYAGGFVYQSHFFKLVAPAVFGEYNDYGWIEDIDQVSLASFVKFAQAVGFEGIDAESFENSENEAIFEVIKESLRKRGRGDPDKVNFDYTFVHRKAWDNLLVAGRQKISHPHVMLEISKDETAALKANVKQFGFKSVNFSKNADVTWLSASATYPQIFCMAMNVLPGLIGELDNGDELPENFSDLPITEQIELLTKTSGALRRSAKYDNSVASWLMSVFSWLRPLMSSGGFMGRMQPRVTETLAVLKAANEDPSFYQALEDLYVMFYSLLDNQIVIRADSDLPTQGQESTYWGFIALVRAMGEIIHQRAEDQMEYAQEDDDVKVYSKDVIENLMQSELNSKY